MGPPSWFIQSGGNGASQAPPVRAENLVRGCDQQGCRPCRPVVMITGHVPAVRLPPDYADDLMAAAVPAWKTAESPLLRHRLAVLRRQQPRCPNLDWADRVLLATLLKEKGGGGGRGWSCCSGGGGGGLG